MGTEWYIARTDTKELFELGKPGFWFADANGLSNDVPCPLIAADREHITALVLKAYPFDAVNSVYVVNRLMGFIGPGATVVSEDSLSLDHFDPDGPDVWLWRGDTYHVVDGVYR